MNAGTTFFLAGALALGLLGQLQLAAAPALAPGLLAPENEAEAPQPLIADIRQTITLFPTNLLWQPAQELGVCRLVVDASGSINIESNAAGGRFLGVFRTIWQRDGAQHLVCLQYPGIETGGTPYHISVFDEGLKLVGKGDITAPEDYIPYGIVEFRQTRLDPRDILDDAWQLGVIVTHPTNRIDLSRDISFVLPDDKGFKHWLFTNRLLVKRLRAGKSPIEVRFGHQPDRVYEFRTAEPNLVVNRNGIVKVRGHQTDEKAASKTPDPSIAPTPQFQR